MDRNVVEKMATDYSQAGFHCAEAVAVTITGIFQEQQAQYALKMATGFGGGLGGSKADICGALSGGVLALGSLFGRTDPKESRDHIYELAAEFKKRFYDQFGSTNCRTILDGFGEADLKLSCRSLTAKTAGILYDLLQENGYRGAAK